MLAARAAMAGAGTWSGEPYAGSTAPVRRQTTHKPSKMTRLAALFSAVAALLLMYVGEQAFVISLTYRLQAAEAALHAAQVQTDRLQLRVSELSSPERIERIAREELHLVSPEYPAQLAEVPEVAAVKPAEEGEAGPTVVARLQRLLRGALVQAAHAAE